MRLFSLTSKEKLTHGSADVEALEAVKAVEAESATGPSLGMLGVASVAAPEPARGRRAPLAWATCSGLGAAPPPTCSAKAFAVETHAAWWAEACCSVS